MADVVETISLGHISQYLWSDQLLKDNAFRNGSINNNRDIFLYIQNKALIYGNNQSLSGIQGVKNAQYHLCGAKLQLASQILNNGTTGGSVNPTTGLPATERSITTQFVVGQITTNPLFNAGQFSFNINLGIGSYFDDSATSSFRLNVNQTPVLRNTSQYINDNYLCYTISYSIVTGLLTVTMNQAAQDTQSYETSGSYLV